MPKRTPKGILPHGGPPSDSSFRLDEGIKGKQTTYGANEEETEACRSATTEMCCVHQPQPSAVRDTMPLGFVFKRPAGMGPERYRTL